MNPIEKQRVAELEQHKEILEQELEQIEDALQRLKGGDK